MTYIIQSLLIKPAQNGQIEVGDSAEAISKAEQILSNYCRGRMAIKRRDGRAPWPGLVDYTSAELARLLVAGKRVTLQLTNEGVLGPTAQIVRDDVLASEQKRNARELGKIFGVTNDDR